MRTLCFLLSPLILALSVHSWAWHTGAHPALIGPTLPEIRTWVRSGRHGQAADALKTLIPVLRGSDRAKATFILGKLQVQLKDKRAVATLESVKPLRGMMNRHSIWLARAKLNVGIVDPTVRRTISQTRGMEKSLLILQLARLQLEKKLPLAALNTANSLSPRRQPKHIRAERLWVIARATEILKPAEADILWRKLALKYPGESATLRSTTWIEKLTYSKRDRLIKAKSLADAWEYDRAVTILEALLAEKYHPNHVRWLLATVLQDKLRQRPERVRSLLRPFVRRTGHRHHQEATYRTMRAYIKEDRYKEALQIAHNYQEALPDGVYAEQVAYYVGWLPYDQGKCRKAIRPFRTYIKKYKQRRTLVRGYLAWCQIRLARWSSAVAAFGRLSRRRHVLHGAKALYWKAYALERLGDRKQALQTLSQVEKAYPLTYYWMLSKQLRARMAGKDATASTLAWPDNPGSAAVHHAKHDTAWSWPQLTGQLRHALKQVRLLSELEEIPQARQAYTKIRKRVEQSVSPTNRLKFILFMCHQINDFHHCFRSSGLRGGRDYGIHPRGADLRWSLAYPEAYRPLVERLATQQKLPSAFVYGIMRAESAYIPTAVSHAEAVGALQMIRPTARLVAQDIGTTYDPVTFWQPKIAFPYSIYYLKKHRQTWNGAFIPTAASYNAGPKPVAKWMKLYKDAKLPFLVEEFVYREARNYARKVAGYVLRYLYLYEKDSVSRGRILNDLFPVKVNYSIQQNVGY
jgi:soluble lytic murein transglycosylase